MRTKRTRLLKGPVLAAVLALTLPVIVAWTQTAAFAPNAARREAKDTHLQQSSVTSTTTSPMNLRARPGTSSQIIGWVPRNKTVPVLGRDDVSHWIFIEYGTRRGWIAGWLTMIDGRLSEVAVTNQVGGTISATPTPVPPPASCQYPWFVQAAHTNKCPDEPAVTTHTAAEYFEHGVMLWLKKPGLYYILAYSNQTTSKEPPGMVYSVADPLNLACDTSARVTAPPGLHAPVSGFGYVWRGDHSPECKETPTVSVYRNMLGWALAPEFGYETTYQCGFYDNWHRACYLYHPDGRLIEIDMYLPHGMWEWDYVK